MTISGRCPECGRGFQGPDKLAGKRVKCPQCSAVIQMGPAGTQPSADDAPAGAKPSQPKPPAEQATSQPATWYVKTADGKQHGPVTRAQLDGLVAAGRLDSFCQIRQQGWQQWKWAEAVYPQFALPEQSEPQSKAVSDQVQASPQQGQTGAAAAAEESARRSSPPPLTNAGRPSARGADPVAPGARSVPAAVEDRLHPCPDCGETVSRRADRCPHCGCPVASAGGPDSADESSAQWAEGPSLAAVPAKASGGPNRAVVAAAAVVLIVVLASAAGWWWFGRNREPTPPPEEVAKQTGPAQPPAEPEPPKEDADSEEIVKLMQEASAAMAKDLDDLYRKVHLAQSLLDRTQQSVNVLKALVDDPLGAPIDTQQLPNAQEEAEPYKSQYEALYKECWTYINENHPTGPLDRSTIWDAARRWADGKRAPLEEQLGNRLGL